MGMSTACFRYLRHSIFTSSRSQKLMMTACFLAAKFSFGENLSFFLAEPIVGGVYDVCDDVFDDVGVVNDTAVDIDDDGVMFVGRVDVDPSDDGDVDDEVDTEMIPRPRCCNNVFRCSVDLPA